MSMTKKDYENIARQIRAARVPPVGAVMNPSRRAGWTLAVDHLADRLAVTLDAANEKFDRARFLAACGVES